MQPRRVPDSAMTAPAFCIYPGPTENTESRPARPAKKEAAAPPPPSGGGLPVRLRVVDSPAGAATPVAQPSVMSVARMPGAAAANPARHEPATRPEIERAMIEILGAPPAIGETIEAAYRRKEQELRDVFARLTPLEARALHRRLTVVAATDSLATQFGRLIEARRVRLLAFLADARRREALALGRRR